eukprot:CAMPEP_0119104812 /NCGR_PEP_ID=MMETSP1180-20130426/2930_1 /TAXON_ID=3052 ORGANISM="Chlamydomonas cf sp, Strain CCMP681" /NCGR_SAMPLE_ID=MMETSP1180 /ASSEMBLY_ACC=CAM_ASM_000741 /LENGTH=138 /DNA_ID=CAMNT_0007089661 /DNA_START=413 /DNA_END=828 /DNA_ORIENTATION=+
MAARSQHLPGIILLLLLAKQCLPGLAWQGAHGLSRTYWAPLIHKWELSWKSWNRGAHTSFTTCANKVLGSFTVGSRMIAVVDLENLVQVLNGVTRVRVLQQVELGSRGGIQQTMRAVGIPVVQGVQGLVEEQVSPQSA